MADTEARTHMIVSTPLAAQEQTALGNLLPAHSTAHLVGAAFAHSAHPAHTSSVSSHDLQVSVARAGVMIFSTCSTIVACQIASVRLGGKLPGLKFLELTKLLGYKLSLLRM